MLCPDSIISLLSRDYMTVDVWSADLLKKDGLTGAEAATFGSTWELIFKHAVSKAPTDNPAEMPTDVLKARFMLWITGKLDGGACHHQASQTL